MIDLPESCNMQTCVGCFSHDLNEFVTRPRPEEKWQAIANLPHVSPTSVFRQENAWRGLCNFRRGWNAFWMSSHSYVLWRSPRWWQIGIDPALNQPKPPSSRGSQKNLHYSKLHKMPPTLKKVAKTFNHNGSSQEQLFYQVHRKNFEKKNVIQFRKWPAETKAF